MSIFWFCLLRLDPGKDLGLEGGSGKQNSREAAPFTPDFVLFYFNYLFYLILFIYYFDFL